MKKIITSTIIALSILSSAVAMGHEPVDCNPTTQECLLVNHPAMDAEVCNPKTWDCVQVEITPKGSWPFETLYDAAILAVNLTSDQADLTHDITNDGNPVVVLVKGFRVYLTDADF